MYRRGGRILFCVVLAAIAASQSGCGASASGEGRAVAPAATGVQPTPSAPQASEPTLPDSGVLAPDEQTLQHVRTALAEELPQVNTAETVDARGSGLIGDGITDETASLRQLLAGGNRTVLIPEGEYLVEQLSVESNTVLMLAPGVVIRDAGRLPAGQALIEIAADNVRIVGPGARIVGAAVPAYEAEDKATRAGIAVRGARNVLIEGLESSGHDGSGFLIGDALGVPATDVVLRACLANDNSRSGVIITSARRVRIVDCELASTAATAQSWGIYLERRASPGVLDDIIAARTATRVNSKGGIMIDLPDVGPAVEATTVTVIEHLSEQEPESLRTVLASEAPTRVSYSRTQSQTPRQTWQTLRGTAGTLVLSYYWPVADETQNFYTLTMATPSVIDILPSIGHGSAEVRSYWTRRGKVLLSRVYPFRVPRGEQELYDYFADAMRGGTGIAIDEVIAHTLNQTQRSALQNVLRRIRSAFPDRLIVVWDASRWEDASQDLLQTLNEIADGIVLETYVSEREAQSSGLARFTRTLQAVESRAPGIRSKIVLGIGAYDAMREPGGDFAAHLELQVRYLARSPELCGTAGLGIYAPVYLSLSEQQRLDAAIRTEFQASSLRASCAGISSE
jgi:hypothetical protein